MSTAALPDSSTIFKAILDVTTAYDPGTTWTFKRTGDATKVLQAVSDNDPTVIGTYEVPQVLNWGTTGAGTVTATIGGTPAAGVATLYIIYSTPISIN